LSAGEQLYPQPLRSRAPVTFSSLSLPGKQLSLGSLCLHFVLSHRLPFSARAHGLVWNMASLSWLFKVFLFYSGSLYNSLVDPRPLSPGNQILYSHSPLLAPFTAYFLKPAGETPCFISANNFLHKRIHSN
jgi:hypothetical protein